MKITFFDVKPWEKTLLDAALTGHELAYFTEPLQEVKDLSTAVDADIISVFVSSKANKDNLPQFKNLKMIAARSTGFDNIDLSYCQEHKIEVAYVPSYGENTVAEHAFALILNLSRNIHKAYLRTIKEDYSLDGLKGFDLQGKTLGVIGAGRIGLHAIRIGRGFGMDVLAFDCCPNEFLSQTMAFSYTKDLNELLNKSDVITVHVPNLPETKHLINKDNIKQIKKGAILINTARGEVIETEALIEALDQEILKGVGLDVLENEALVLEEHRLADHQPSSDQLAELAKDHVLLRRDNVIYTPHMAFYSQEAIDRITHCTIENLVAFAAGKKINLVKTNQ